MAGTRWASDDWERYYIDHPVTGTLARSLLWEASADGGEQWIAGLPERTAGGWALAGADGTAAPGDGRLRVAALASGARATPTRYGSGARSSPNASCGSRSSRPSGRSIRSPRPRRRPARYSNRFAGHILRYNQAKALMVERGWLGNHLGLRRRIRRGDGAGAAARR